MPDTTPDRVAHVVERGLAHAADCGLGSVELEAEREGDVMRKVLEISSLHEDYRLSSRVDTTQLPHHMINAKRNHPDPEARLRQTSLYRPDLDLVVRGRRNSVAANGLFWYDPETATGLVEPMRTEDDHQRRGFARHVLTNGLGLLADAGAKRIKIVYEPGNPAASHLYLSVGFRPHRHTDLFAGQTEVPASPVDPSQ